MKKTILRARNRKTLSFVLTVCVVAAAVLVCRLQSDRDGPRVVPAEPGPTASAEARTRPQIVPGDESGVSGAGRVAERTWPPAGSTAPSPPRPSPILSVADLLARAQHLEIQAMPGGDKSLRRVAHLVRVEDSKYPLLRVEESLEPGAAGESRVSASVMAADHVVVKVKPGAEDVLRGDAERIPGGAFVQKLYAPDLFLVHAVTPGLDTVPALRAALETSRAVQYTEPDSVAFLRAMPNDPSFNTKWGLHNTGQSGGTVDADIDAPEAWDISTGLSNVIVAVADSGVLTTHEDLEANIWQNPGETGLDTLGGDKGTNGVDDDGNGFVDDVVGWDFANNDNTPDDPLGHGTHVAGIVGAVGNNGTGVAGVCWTVRIIAMALGDFAFYSDAASAIVYASDNGARAFNASWGGPDYSQALYDAAQYAGTNGLGMVISCAAGNDSKDIDQTTDYPVGFDLDNIIGVASTDRNDGLSSFSNFGATEVDVGAPGSGINSTVTPSGYRTEDGTSMAAPQVTGACGLLLSVNPSLTALQIKQRLMDTVDPLPGLSGKCVSGGRINVHRACEGMAAPLIRLREHAIVDSNDPPYAGNGDGFANPGETVGLSMFVENSGLEGVTGLTATAQLKQADPTFNIVSDTVGLGDLAGSSSLATGPVFRIEVGTPATQPHTVDVEVVFSASSPSDVTWTSSFPVVVSVPASISGRVIRIATGEGIAGANVVYAGPVSGSVRTDADGLYTIAALGGTYSLTASATGLVDSATEQVTVPPDRTDVTLMMGTVTIAAEGPAGEVLLYPGERRTIPLHIAHRGDAPVPLTYSLTIDGRAHARSAGHADRFFSLDGFYPTALSERNPSTGAKLYTVTLTGDGFFDHVCFDGEYVYVLEAGMTGGAYLHTRDPDTGAAVGAPLALTGVVGVPRELTADDDGLLMFNDAGTGYRIDTSTGALTPVYTFGPSIMLSLAFAPDRDTFFALELDQAWNVFIHERRVSDQEIENTISPPAGEDPLCLTYLGGAGTVAFLSAGFSGTQVRFYDPDTGGETGSFAADPETVDIYAANIAGTTWLTASNRTGSVNRGGVTNVPLYADAAELAVGSYTGRVEITSNDPANSPLPIEVRVRVVDVAGYAAWRTLHFGAETVPGDGYGDDPEGDGRPNLVEFLLNGSPSDANALLRPVGVDDGECLCELTWRKGTHDGLLQLQTCHDLRGGGWGGITEGSGYTIRSRTDVGADYERVVIDLHSAQPVLFLRPIAAP